MLRQTIFLITLISAISNLAFADDAYHLTKGDVAPISGYLMSDDLVKTLRADSIEAQYDRVIIPKLQSTINLQQDIIGKKDQQLSLVFEQNDKLSKAAFSDHQLSTLEKVGYFVLGIVVTYGAFKLAQEATR